MSTNPADFGATIDGRTCGTCSKGPQQCAIFDMDRLGNEEIRLCHSCLVDLANLVFEAEAARPTDPKPSRTQGGFVSVTEKK